MLPLRILTFYFLTFAIHAQAQYENLLHKPNREKEQLLRDFTMQPMATGDTVALFQKIAALQQAAVDNHDPELELEARILRNFITAHRIGAHSTPMLKQASDDLKTIIAEAEKKGLKIVQVKASHLLSLIYWDYFQNYEGAFAINFSMDSLVEGISAAEFPAKLDILYYIGLTYYQFSDYRLALRYCHKALEVPPVLYTMNAWLSCCNTIGMCYENLRMADSSDYFFKKTMENATDYQWRAIARGNLAEHAFKKGLLDSAAGLLEKSYQESMTHQDIDIMSGTALSLADLYFAQGKPTAAARLIAQVDPIVRKYGRFERHKSLFSLLSKMYAYQGNPKLSALYLDSSMMVKDSLANRYNSLKLMAANQKLAQQQHKNEMDGANSEKTIKIYQRNGLLALMLIGICATLVFYKYKSTKHRQLSLINSLEKEKASQELANAADQLEQFKLHLAANNELMEHMQRQTEAHEADAHAILYKTSLLTSEQWQRFRVLFDTVYKGYLERLEQKIPDLTPAELRLMALAKLGLSQKEMAATLGISPQSVRVSRHRLRKKLQLPEEGGLEELVNSI